MLSSISELQKKIWDKWNIRLVILFSLFLQIFLIISAPSRKRTRSFFVFFVWLAYLLADWAAGYCIGLISNNQEQKSKLSENDCLMAFWGPFLLLHLGGPDTISAFALEDNELWLRHLLGFIFQSVTTAYVFLLTVPGNKLCLPTILMFVAGLIKYAERTHALYVAAVNNFRKSLIPHPDAGPNYAKLMEEHSSREKAGLPAKIIMIPELRQRSYEAAKSNANQKDKVDNQVQKADDDEPKVEQKADDDEPKVEQKAVDKLEVEEKALRELELAQKALFFFHKFQGLIVDMIYSFKDRLDSQKYFEDISAEDALRLIEIELNFMYEVFYTKASVVRQYWFWFWGKFVSLILITATVAIFIKADKHGFNNLDVRVTYALLFGALVLDVMALIMRFFTDYTATLSDESLLDSYAASSLQKFRIKCFKCLNKIFLARYLRLRKPTWPEIKKGRYKNYHKLSTKFLFRRWSGSISGYNLLKYCLDESVPRVPIDLHGSFHIVQVIQRVWFRIKVFVQDLVYQRDKNSVIKDLLDQRRYESKNPFLKELWEYTFGKLKKKSHDAKDIEAIQSICSARGERVVQEANLESLKPFVDPNEVAFDESLLLWHIATALCYAEDTEVKEKKKEISMLLSDYMLYLLVMQPNMMSAIAGIGQMRFQDTCEEAKRFFRRRIPATGDREAMLKEACKFLMEVPTGQKPSDVKGDRSKSLLFDACRLAKELKKLPLTEEELKNLPLLKNLSLTEEDLKNLPLTEEELKNLSLLKNLPLTRGQLKKLEDELKKKKWEIITCVWVELLSYAACHCRPTGHAQLLSKGGELISFVWLLLVQLGLGTQFQIKEGDARAKLIVGKLLK